MVVIPVEHERSFIYGVSHVRFFPISRTTGSHLAHVCWLLTLAAHVRRRDRCRRRRDTTTTAAARLAPSLRALDGAGGRDLRRCRSQLRHLRHQLKHQVFFVCDARRNLFFALFYREESWTESTALSPTEHEIYKICVHVIAKMPNEKWSQISPKKAEYSRRSRTASLKSPSCLEAEAQHGVLPLPSYENRLIRQILHATQEHSHRDPSSLMKVIEGLPFAQEKDKPQSISFTRTTMRHNNFPNETLKARYQIPCS